jgi:hypothetical protein
MFEIPSRDDIVSCVVTRDVFLHGKPPLLYNGQGQQVSLGRELKSAA